MKFELFISIRKWFSILLFISLIGWVLFLLGIDLPNSTLYYGKIDNSFQYSYSNYFIFLSNNMVLHRDYFRFSSVFLEPGYLGCLLSVFLFLSKYKFDKINIIFFFAIFFTFSLAGYIISIFGYLLFTFRNTRRKVLWVVITFLCYFMIIYFAKNINNGENWINNAIVERLQPDDLKLFSGYNRSSEESDNLFWNSFIYSEDLLFGNGKTIEYNDVDWKSYIYAYGLISFLLYIFYLFFPLLIRDKNKYFTFIFVSIYLMIFAQTIHGMFWLFYLFLFIIGIDVNRKILKKS
ncbi:MAG: hypothetical protein RBT49_00980 [Bacteroidales bacterium]|nr:hypothetical protein [Bacteroidales bacterium]